MSVPPQNTYLCNNLCISPFISQTLYPSGDFGDCNCLGGGGEVGLPGLPGRPGASGRPGFPGIKGLPGNLGSPGVSGGQGARVSKDFRVCL